MRRLVVTSVLVAIAANLLGCDQFVDVRLRSGATTSLLKFDVVQRGSPDRSVRLLRMLWVQRCAGERRPPLWEIQTRDENSIIEFTYGTAPAHWSTVVAPKQLSAGCYYIHAQGPRITGTRFLSVDSVGGVTSNALRDSGTVSGGVRG